MRQKNLNTATHILFAAIAALVVFYFADLDSAPSEADPSLEQPTDKPEPQPMRTEPFTRLDRNADGGISLREARREPELESRFRDMDLNGDGQLSETEFRHFLENQPPASDRKAEEPQR